MSKITDLINETTARISERMDQAKQAEQFLNQTHQEIHALNARLATLQEIAATGRNVFDEPDEATQAVPNEEAVKGTDEDDEPLDVSAPAE